MPAENQRRENVQMYTQPWCSPRRGYLINQLATMAEPLESSQNRGERRKCARGATILNGFLGELIATNTFANPDGTTEVRSRADISTLGYGGQGVDSAFDGNLKGQALATLADLHQNPVDIEMREKKDIDDTGAEIKVPVPFPVWVRAKADGGTPMCAALQRARDLAAQWVQAHPDNDPPIVVNITAGWATDVVLAQAARDLCQEATSGGQTLPFTLYLSNLNTACGRISGQRSRATRRSAGVAVLFKLQCNSLALQSVVGKNITAWQEDSPRRTVDGFQWVHSDAMGLWADRDITFHQHGYSSWTKKPLLRANRLTQRGRRS